MMQDNLMGLKKSKYQGCCGCCEEVNFSSMFPSMVISWILLKSSLF